ncbi:MAG TPA: N-6 DNA methylase [Ktedonobacteraceae bacterium]|jgi:SAM-dependent methyltransferase
METHEPAPGGWYEAELPGAERKRRGHFSTPHALVEQILDACHYTPDADLPGVRLLDPACGSGNFLACAARRLCMAAQTRGLNQEQAGTLVQRNLWGLDPDPVACLLAEMQVRAASEAAGGSLPTLMPLHVHQADSLALPWQPCVDLLVANPPYLAAKNTDLSYYRQARRRGQADSYLLFLNLALRAVRPGGWLGLVLPDPVLARANAATERAYLLHDFTLMHIWHLANVFAADVGAAVLIAQKVPPRPVHRTNWTRARWQSGLLLTNGDRSIQRVAQMQLSHQPGAELRYLLGQKSGRELERLRRALAPASPRPIRAVHLLPLEHIVNIRRGEEIGRSSPHLGVLADMARGYPVLRGGVDLRAYARPASALGIVASAVKKPLARYREPKLLVVKSTGDLRATLDTGGHVVLQTLYLLHLHAQESSLDTYYFLLALLNSRLLRAYVYYLHTAYKVVQPQIEQAVLARLPVPWADAQTRAEICASARELERACSRAGSVVEWDEHITCLYERQESAIRALYAAAAPGIFLDKGVFFYG